MLGRTVVAPFRRSRRPAPPSGAASSASEPARRSANVVKRWARDIGIGRALAIVLLVLLIAVRIWDPAPVEAVRLRTFDAFQILQPRTPIPSQPVMIVDIDEASLRELGQWPWPRTRVAELVTRLTAAGAVVIAFDIAFPEPDRLSPGLLADTLPNLDAPTREALRRQPSNDEVLAAAMRRSRVVLGQTALSSPVPWSGSEAPPQTMIGIRAPRGVNIEPFLTKLPGLLRNIPVLEQAAIGRGLFTIVPERDGIVRRVPLILKADDVLMPTLTLDLLRILTGAPGIVVKGDAAGVQGIVLPQIEIPTDPYGQVWVHFAPRDPTRFVSAADLLRGAVPNSRFTNKIVLVGTSAIGLLDNKTTPIDRSMPGVEVHAQLLESALTRTTLVAPNYATVIELLVAVAVAFAIILFAPILGAVNLLLFGAVVASFLGAASWYRYAQSGILLDATFPLASSFLIYLTLVFTNYLREQMGRARIRSAFGQYLSPALVEQLAQNPEKLKLGGEERCLTIMFSDVRGFTTISESYKHDPQGLTALMNRFLTPLTNAILDRKGTIDKYMGDAIMAFWNAPIDDPRHEANACRAALDMLARMRRVNAEREAEAAGGGHRYIPIEVGIGLNTGICVVGNMGSNLRFDYSVLGDPVNLASRLEGQSKTYGVRIVLGATTAATVADEFALLEIDLIKVKGKTEPETVFTLVGDEALRRDPVFTELAAAHAEMIVLYRDRDWDGASARLERCRAAARDLGIEGLYGLYAARIAGFRETPPPATWTGIHTAESK
jgi:adenylate cyclase